MHRDGQMQARYRVHQVLSIFLLMGSFFFSFPVFAQETVCARVKIQIKQELTLERQAFEAEMKINNTTDTGVIQDVSVVVKITDENGTPIKSTDDPNDLSARFFVRLSNKENISDVDGNGTVNPKTSAVIDWLIIPAPGAAGVLPSGKKYLVGATLKYRFGGEEHTLDVSPDVITVKPLPLLALDYFLTEHVLGDDPLTAEVEPVEPFTLGVRVRNNGLAIAKKLKIDSAQPTIVENNQGLLINFSLTGSYVDDLPVQNTLLIDFGDILPESAKMGRWVMESTLAGKFTEFSARFSHADELGGALTSILEATNAHFLIHDVRVDLPGRDAVRDFLARDGDFIRVYESDGPDTLVTDRSSSATLVAAPAAGGEAAYTLTFPATAGPVYVSLPDPFSGAKVPGKMIRSDTKPIAPENFWLSRTRDENTKQWHYWVNLFDVNSTGSYEARFTDAAAGPKPPAIQFITDRTIEEGKTVSFIVEASGFNGKPLTLKAEPLPVGATFTLQAVDPATPNTQRAIFSWKPGEGSAGVYPIVYVAADGLLSSTRSAKITVESNSLPLGPEIPTIDAPLPGARVTSLKPALSVQPGNHSKDPTTQIEFELYADEALTQKVASTLLPKALPTPGGIFPTSWTVPSALLDNTHYWWRARAFDGSVYSAWVEGRFFVNLYNDPPSTFNLLTPAPGAEVDTLTPRLAWSNGVDKDEDVISYDVKVFADAGLSEPVAFTQSLAEDPSGMTQWVVSPALSDQTEYYWQATAKDTSGGQTVSAARMFKTNIANKAPSDPVMISPVKGGESANYATSLVIQNSTDVDGDALTYVFEIDAVKTFDSAAKQTSGLIAEDASGTTQWVAAGLIENQRYWWRVKASDGKAESGWSLGRFLMNAVNDPPPAPAVSNPGNGAWIAVQQPTLAATPVVDPEGEAVHYQYEIFSDSGLTNKVAGGMLDTTSWTVSSLLPDSRSYWWHVRALDPHNAASGWSTTAVFHLSTSPYTPPAVALTTPATLTGPEIVGGRKVVTLRWDSIASSSEPTVALYYSTDNTSFSGNLIIDGLKQPVGKYTGSYEWEVSALAPGAYYVYAMIYDAKSTGKAYAPGAVIVPPGVQSGSIVVSGWMNLRTTVGSTSSFKIRLSSAPLSDVVIPLTSSNLRKGRMLTPALTFTPQNWSVDQSAVVEGQNDCVPVKPGTSTTYTVTSGKTVTLDPNYIGLTGRLVGLGSKLNLVSTTNNSNLHICSLILQSETQLSATSWEYLLTAELANTGAGIKGVTARLAEWPPELSVVEGSLIFGAVGEDEFAQTTATVRMRSASPIPESVFRLGQGFKWEVTVKP